MWHWPRAVTWNTEQHTNHRKETFSRKLCVENREDWTVRNFANSISWPGDNTSLDTDTTCSWTDDLDCKTAFEIFAKEEKKTPLFLIFVLDYAELLCSPHPPTPRFKGWHILGGLGAFVLWSYNCCLLTFTEEHPDKHWRPFQGSLFTACTTFPSGGSAFLNFPTWDVGKIVALCRGGLYYV